MKSADKYLAAFLPNEILLVLEYYRYRYCKIVQLKTTAAFVAEIWSS